MELSVKVLTELT